MIKFDIVQVAYHVVDIRAAAATMVERFGAGPFFVNEGIALSWAEHRGQPADFVHSSAYGQWGGVMMELVQQDDDSTATPFRDMYQRSEEGIHHTAMFVPNMDDAIQHFDQQGLKLATRCATLHGGVEFAFIDATETLGHMIEIYEPTEPVASFYQMVREASVNWSGENPIRG